MDLITIFTPAYNRGHLLPRLYDSLLKQTDQRFEWVIVDDGSTDHTQATVAEWLSSHLIPITYLKVANGGKHRAINLGVKQAKGELFFIVDSDDWLAENAVERLFFWEASIHDKAKFAGVAGLKAYEGGKICGTTFNEDYIDATSLERKQYRIEGDKSEAFYTSVLKRYPFPEIEGEMFLTEDIVWERIGYDGLKMRWFNDPIYYCEQGEDGLTAQGRTIFARNPKGYALSVQQKMKFYHQSFYERILSIYYYYLEVSASVSMKDAAHYLGISLFQLKTAYYIQLAKVSIKKFCRR